MIIYEDANIQADFPDAGVTKGHIVLLPKKQVNTIEELDDALVTQLFTTASFAATVLFESLGAQGTNIILNEHPLCIHVIARTMEDAWSHQWSPSPIDQAQMDDVVGKIDKHIPLVGQEVSQEVKQPSTKPVEEQRLTQEEAKENYLIRQLHRVP